MRYRVRHRRMSCLILMSSISTLAILWQLTLTYVIRDTPRSKVKENFLEMWRRYAAARQCPMGDSQYLQIFKDLSRFKGRLITRQEVESILQIMSYSVLISVANGTVTAEGKHSSNHKVVYLCEIIRSFLLEIPEIAFVVTVGDEPLSWIAPLPDEGERDLRNGIITDNNAWAKYGCDGAGHQAVNKSQHGMFTHFKGKRGLVPIFGAYHIEDCFADILIPVPGHIPSELKLSVQQSACPLDDKWDGKKEIAFWRGASTGGFYVGDMPKETWSNLHRQRLVAYSQQNPSHIDARFTEFLQCDGRKCKEMNATYGLSPKVTFSEIASYKYLLAIDGNGAPDSMAPMLCSGSLVLDASLLEHWYSFKLKPYEHFVPVRLDYLDLAEKVQWARNHDQEARRIADAASALVNTRLRGTDKECYIYRLLLEYSTLYRK